MWKPKLYLAPSNFYAILSNWPSVDEISLDLLRLCKEDGEYEGYVSPFTLLELSKRFNEKEMNMLYELIAQYDLKLIEYRTSKEIDYLANNYQTAKILPDLYALDYYHVATCAYLNIEYYVCWNEEYVVNFQTFRRFIYSHVPRGYRSIIQLATPTYFTGMAKSVSIKQLFSETFNARMSALNEILHLKLEERTNGIQKSILSNLEGRIPTTLLPNEKIRPARIPVLELPDIQLAFQVTSFHAEIKNKEIPLLDLGYEEAGFGMDYHLFKLQTVEGIELLKNKQLEIIINLPTKSTREEAEAIQKQRNTDFIKWLLPQIRIAIDPSTKEYPENNWDYLSRYSYREIDYRLASSISGESISKIKRKALELAEMVTGKAWQYYQGFSFSGEWCMFNENYDHGNGTHLIVEKDGKEVWVILINTIIP